jgi:2-dehydropantoate 2-reductase
MKIAVIGPGAVGILYAARLANAGSDVTLVDHSPSRIERLNASGITVEAASGTQTSKVAVSDTVPPDSELVLICVKAHSTTSLHLPKNVPVLTIQNGLNNVETIVDMVGNMNVLAGVTSEAVTLLDEGHIRHVAHGTTTFGTWTECSSDPVENALTEAGFACAVTDAPGQTIWEKTAVNAGINPLTALLNVPNGQLLEVRESRELLRDLVVEAAKVASIEGYRFSHSLVEVAEDTCAQTAENISSMLQDVRAQRKTEIDAISGEIVRRADAAALPVPRTRVILQLIRGLESR